MPNPSARIPWITALTLAALCHGAFAQARIESATQRLERTGLQPRLQTPASEEIAPLYVEEEKDIGPQHLILQKPRHLWLEAAGDLQFGSTSNVYLAEDGKTDSSLMTSTLQIAITPPAWKLDAGELSAKAGYRHQKFNYGIATGGQESSINDVDFDISSLFFQGSFLYNERWLTTLGLEHNRLLNASAGSYDEFYTEFAPSLSFSRNFALTQKSALVTTISLGGHFSRIDSTPSSPSDAFDRADESATVSYTAEILPQTLFQSYYRAQFTQYTRSQGRRDLVHVVGVGLSFALCKNASLRIFANFESRDSSDPFIADYQKLDTGLGSSLRLAF
jgi:hypothetical protein